MQKIQLRGVLEQVNVETRNALHAILGFVSAVEDGELSDQQRARLARCRSAAGGLVARLGDAMECCRVQPTTPPEPQRDFEVSRTAEALVDVYGAIARSKSLQLHCVIDEDVPRRCHGWPDAIERALGRLLQNAVTCTTQGEVRMQFDFLPEAGAGTLRVAISDTGPGLDEDLLAFVEKCEGVFIPSRRSSRVGFGLYLAKRDIDSIGGTLSLQNRGAGGCQAVVTVPISSAVSPTAQPGNSVSVAGSDRIPAELNILVAEDSDDSYALLELFLSAQGHKLLRASDGLQAVTLGETSNYDMVIMDVHMPGLDGYSAARQLRVWETVNARPHVPIVMLSADPLQTQVRKGAVAGCSAYLEKPVSPGKLLETIAAFAPP